MAYIVKRKMKKGNKTLYHIYTQIMVNDEKKPKYDSTYLFEGQAKDKLLKLQQRESDQKNGQVNYGVTIWEQCDNYFNLPKKRTPGTLRIIKDAIKWIKAFPEFHKNKLIVDITTKDVQKFITWLLNTKVDTPYIKKEPFNHTSTHLHMRNFSSILRNAKDIIPENPAKQPLKDLGKPTGSKIFLSHESVDELLNAALALKMRKPGRNLELWKMIKVLLATGVRRAELLNMRKEHIFNNNRIEIPTEARSDAESLATKSDEPYVIDLNDEIVPFFNAVESGLIFSGWTANSFNHEFKRAAILARLPELRPHDMRHTFAKNALESGTTLLELKSMLNHKNLATTLQYARFDKSRLRERYNAMIRPKTLKVAGE